MERNLDEYIAGFVDGEGCFALSYRRDVRHDRKTQKIYFSWKAVFAIELRGDDVALLQIIRDRLGCGSITFSKGGSGCRYQVTNLDELNHKIAPFFSEKTLLGKKGHNFILWREAIGVLYARKVRKTGSQSKSGIKGFAPIPLSEGEITRLKALHDLMQPFKSISSAKKKWTQDLAATGGGRAS